MVATVVKLYSFQFYIKRIKRLLFINICKRQNRSRLKCFNGNVEFSLLPDFEFLILFYSLS